MRFLSHGIRRITGLAIFAACVGALTATAAPVALEAEQTGGTCIELDQTLSMCQGGFALKLDRAVREERHNKFFIRGEPNVFANAVTLDAGRADGFGVQNARNVFEADLNGNGRTYGERLWQEMDYDGLPIAVAIHDQTEGDILLSKVSVLMFGEHSTAWISVGMTADIPNDRLFQIIGYMLKHFEVRMDPAGT
ncbi:hypothetical protein [Pseudaestuariivita sp.]|uniref:hypothetical protein n=1 Tax=Pseudaestuariivita sp. TaxID=2211669 RepID=UPI004058CA8E